MIYEPVRPPFRKPFREMTIGEIDAYGTWFHSIVAERLAILEKAVNTTEGFEAWRADDTPASLAILGEWFVRQVSGRGRTVEEAARIYEAAPAWFASVSIGKEELTNQSFSLAFDLAIYLSSVFLSTHGSLTWSQDLVNKKSVDYGQPVLNGFGKVPFNPVRMMVTHAYGVLQGKRNGESLLRLFEYWSALARGEKPPQVSGIVLQAPEIASNSAEILG